MFLNFNYNDAFVGAVRGTILLLHSVFRGLQAVYQGAIPPLLGYERLHRFNSIAYDHEVFYTSEEYNKRGFFDWEREAIDNNLTKGTHFLVLSAGGGREVIALLREGFEVDAWECNEKLYTFGNTLLEKEGFSCRISPVAPNMFPPIPPGKVYDFCIIGWGAYCQIFPREYRVNLLSQCRGVVKGPVLISYLPIYERGGKSKKVWALARRLVRTLPFFFKDVHEDIVIFQLGVYEGISEEKVKQEAEEAGYDVIMIKTKPYCHAVLVPKAMSCN